MMCLGVLRRRCEQMADFTELSSNSLQLKRYHICAQYVWLGGEHKMRHKLTIRVQAHGDNIAHRDSSQSLQA